LEKAGRMSIYLPFFGLKEAPFNITPDPRFLYFSPRHKEAFDHLVFGIQERRGFIELVGEVGAGKTTLLRAVLAALPKNVQTALILNPSLSETQLLRAILNDLGLAVKGRDRLGHIEQLNQYLLFMNKEGYNVALFIDEAQNLLPDVMEQIRLLSNLETDQHKLMQIVLAGQPELEDRLNRKDLRQLRQRITVRCRLDALNEEETAQYIAHRLRVAGAGEDVLFEPSAVKVLFKAAKGTPRVTNTIADRAMLAGYVHNSRQIGETEVRRALQEIEVNV
jgi:general secretion pathway protein A